MIYEEPGSWMQWRFERCSPHHWESREKVRCVRLRARIEFGSRDCVQGQGVDAPVGRSYENLTRSVLGCRCII